MRLNKTIRIIRDTSGSGAYKDEVLLVAPAAVWLTLSLKHDMFRKVADWFSQRDLYVSNSRPNCMPCGDGVNFRKTLKSSRFMEICNANSLSNEWIFFFL